MEAAKSRVLSEQRVNRNCMKWREGKVREVHMRAQAQARREGSQFSAKSEEQGAQGLVLVPRNTGRPASLLSLPLRPLFCSNIEEWSSERKITQAL